MKEKNCLSSEPADLARRFCSKKVIRLAALTTFWVTSIATFIFASLILVTRYVVFPKIDSYNAKIAETISSAINAEVKIAHIVPSWERLWPRLSLQDVSIQKLGSEDSLTFPEVNASFYWGTLLGKPVFKSLEIRGATLEITRFSDTHFSIAGFEFDVASDSEVKKPNSFFPFFERQGRLDVTAGTIRYTDLRRKDAEAIEATNLNATFTPHLRHWDLGLQADVLDRKLDIRAKLKRPFAHASDDWRTWNWTVYTKLDALELSDTEPWTEGLNPFASGLANGEIWLGFEEGKLQSVKTDLVLTDVSLLRTEYTEPLAAKRLELQGETEFNDSHLTVSVSRLALETPKGRNVGPLEANFSTTFEAGTTQTHSAEGTLSEVNLTAIREALSEYPFVPKEIQDTLNHYAPKGTVSNLVLSWKGAITKPTAWFVKTDFAELGIQEEARETGVGIPGFSGLTGSVQADNSSGTLTISSCRSLSFPGVFENAKIPFDTLAGKVTWSTPQKGNPLTVQISEMAIANSDLAITLTGSWKGTEDAAGYADLEGRIERLKAESAWRYLPLVLSEGTRHWLEGGLRGGVARDGKYIVRGALKDFPWHNADKKKGHFLATATLTEGLLDFMPQQGRPQDGKWQVGQKWPVISDITATLLFEGSAMDIQAQSATTLGVVSKNVRATIPKMGHGDTLLTIKGDIPGSLDKMARYLEQSPVGKMLGGAFNGAKATGDANLNLDLTIPLTGETKTRVKGLISFKKNDFTMAYPVPPLTGLEGSLSFTESGADSEAISATALGVLTTARVSTDSDGTIRITTSGKFSPKELNFFVDTPLMRKIFSRLEGETPVAVDIQIPHGKGVSVTAVTSLVGVKSNFPEPLAKKAEETWQTTFSTEPSAIRGKTGRLLKLTAADKVDMILQMGDKTQGIAALGGIAIGRKAALPNAGLTMDIRANEMSLPAWYGTIAELISAAKEKTKTSSATESLSLQSIRYDLDAFKYDEIHLTDVKGQAKLHGNNTWEFTIRSREAEGELAWDFSRGINGHVEAHFSRYHFPETFSENFHEAEKSSSTKDLLPSINLTVADLAYEKALLGALTFRATTPRTSQGTTWRIDKLTVKNKAATLSANGEWTADGNTSLSATLDLADGGDFLKHLGHPGILGKGSGRIETNFFWNGTPWDPDVTTLQGNIHVDMKNGYLEQADMGVGGALLSLVSIQSLVRNLTVGLFESSRNNFTFNSFTGDALIADGILTSTNMELIGTNASITLSGSANFVTEKLDAQATVVPNIDASAASVPLAFINPLIGIGAYVGQWIISKPLNHLLTTKYSITGTFENPTVTKLLDNSGLNSSSAKFTPEAANDAP